MAIFHMTAKIVSRSRGQSAVAKASYNSRQALTNEGTGEKHDYTRRGGVVFEGVFAPKDAPEWARDRGALWSEVERFEKRKDAQLAREVEVALPHELSSEQQRQLVTDYVRENFIRKGMVADVAIHEPGKEGDQRNDHAHILLTLREIGPEGFGPKVREWNAKEQLETWRENWARTANRYLERHGHEARIDHRTLEEQGNDKEATVHLGPSATQAEREGEQTERGDINRRIEERNQERESLKIALSATVLELADAQRTKGDEEEWEWAKIKPKTRAPYSLGGMVPQQQDAQRDFEKRSKQLQEHQTEQRKQRQAEEERVKNQGSSSRTAEDERRAFWDEFRELRGDVAGQKREEKKARTEQTDYQRARSERDALRERLDSRPSTGRERDDDESGRERERER